MVATTNSQFIRYPQTTDAPCDGDLHFQFMAEDIDAKLTSHHADLDRTELPPAVVWSMSTPYTVDMLFELPLDVWGNPIPFDSVEHQVGGTFVDIAANAGEWRVPRIGVYQTGLEVQIAPDSHTEEYHGFRLVQTNPILDLSIRHGVQQHDIFVGFVDLEDEERMTFSGMFRVSDTSKRFSWRWTPRPSVNITTINLIRAWAFWVAD
jgi:hypothetical protein